MSILRIVNGIVYDPANDVDGVVQDIWIRDGYLHHGGLAVECQSVS